jgi:hypothetical protein
MSHLFFALSFVLITLIVNTISIQSIYSITFGKTEAFVTESDGTPRSVPVGGTINEGETITLRTPVSDADSLLCELRIIQESGDITPFRDEACSTGNGVVITSYSNLPEHTYNYRVSGTSSDNDTQSQVSTSFTFTVADGNADQGASRSDDIDIEPAKLSIGVEVVQNSECSLNKTCITFYPEQFNVDVYTFYDNHYNRFSQFPGSNLSKVVVFSEPSYFEWTPLFVEVTIDNDELSLPYYPVYDSCITYLNPGEIKECKITMIPMKTESVGEEGTKTNNTTYK